MPTYPHLQAYICAVYGFWPQTCWIAHVKADLGLTTRVASNRASLHSRKKPCPPGRRAAIEDALKRFE